MNPVNCNHRSNATIRRHQFGEQQRNSVYKVSIVVAACLGLVIINLMNLELNRHVLDQPVAKAAVLSPTPMGREPFMPGPAITTRTLQLELDLMPTPNMTKTKVAMPAGTYLPVVIVPYTGTALVEVYPVTRTTRLSDTAVYTPAVLQPMEATVFGVETNNLLAGGEYIANAGASWVRRNSLVWY